MVKIIAEAGVNHNGSLDLALELVEIAAKCKGDAVKFQTFKAGSIVINDAAKANYQIGKSSGETQADMLRSLELSHDEFIEVGNFSRSKGIEFISTPFDVDSLHFLVDTIGVETLKISSGDITNYLLLYTAGLTQKNIIISTGASSISEISKALNVLSAGRQRMSTKEIKEFSSKEYSIENIPFPESVTILHCTSEYPAPFVDLNLAAIPYLKEIYSLKVGYSDHSLGIEASIAATALGAEVIEKHFTFDRNAEGPDHSASLLKQELLEMTNAIRNVDVAIGNPEKKAQSSEALNINLIRRGLYANRSINKGETLTEADVAVLRPANGIDPIRYWDYVGHVATRDLASGEDLAL